MIPMIFIGPFLSGMIFSEVLWGQLLGFLFLLALLLFFYNIIRSPIVVVGDDYVKYRGSLGTFNIIDKPEITEVIINSNDLYFREPQKQDKIFSQTYVGKAAWCEIVEAIEKVGFKSVTGNL